MDVRLRWNCTVRGVAARNAHFARLDSRLNLNHVGILRCTAPARLRGDACFRGLCTLLLLILMFATN